MDGWALQALIPHVDGALSNKGGQKTMGSSGVVGHYFKSSSQGGVTGLTDAQNEPKSFFFFFFGVTNHSFDPLLTQRLIHHTPPFAVVACIIDYVPFKV